MLNIYFGGSTVFGKKQKILLNQHFSQSLRDRQRWRGSISYPALVRMIIVVVISIRERKGKGIMDWVILVIWDLWSLTKTKTMTLDHNQVGFVDSVSGSVLSLSWSSSTGFPSDSVEIYDLMRKENLFCVSFSKAGVMCIYIGLLQFTTPNWPRKVHEMKWTIWYAFKRD